MEAVLKVGGSLAEYPSKLRNLCRKLALLAEDHNLLVVPGGGQFADAVRNADKTYRLSSTIAHKMAILAMDQFGLLLSDITPHSYVSYSLKKVKNSTSGALPIFLPSRLILSKGHFEPCWDVTSDSIAAYIADIAHAEMLVLVTDVDGIFTESPKKSLAAELIAEVSVKQLLSWNKRTSVDRELPRTLLNTKLNCYVVNGQHPRRIKAILERQESVYTHITV